MQQAEKCPKFKNILSLRTYRGRGKAKNLRFWWLYKDHGKIFPQLFYHCNIVFSVVHVQVSVLNIFYFLLGHPNKMFRFPSPSTSKGWVGRSDKKKIIKK